jgi:hypothetical protein
MRCQRGISLVGMLFAFVLAGFFVTIGVTLGPHYLEFLTVKSIIKDVAEDPELTNAGKMDVLKTIQNRLYVNSVRSIDPKSFSYRETTRGYGVGVDYQVKEHLFANVGVVPSFTDETVSEQP